MHAATASPDDVPAPELVAQIQRVLDRVAVELFAAYDLPVAPAIAAATPPAQPAAAVIAFTGDLAGELRLTAPPAVLAATCPGGAPLDWLCELVNQLVGRLKNELWPSGITIRLTAPTTEAGDATAATPLIYASAHGAIAAWLRFVAAPGVCWRDARATQRLRVAYEGDVLFF
ncbi:MAG: hypothetical protein JNK64_29880 [Myxococcales bacterium]|nr:hypothetical protein [Myxococcales bacterium]